MCGTLPDRPGVCRQGRQEGSQTGTNQVTFITYSGANAGGFLKGDNLGLASKGGGMHSV